MRSGLTRRELVAAASAMGATLAWTKASALSTAHGWSERRDLYPEGVASGDPASDSVILWTRRPPAKGHAVDHLHVEVSPDEHFSTIVATATAPVLAENDWTVRILAAGLKPSTFYWYRFADEHGFGSRIGRTRTAPAADDDQAVRFTFVCCQNVTQGACNAYRRMIWDDAQKPEAEQLDFVMHLGDFFYEIVWYPEDRPQGMYARRIREVVRYPHGEKHADFHVPTDVGDYRAIFRGYLADPDLADARARWPFVCMWDNHEFSWKGWQSYEDYGSGPFPAQTRKVAAAQAWFEYQPARIAKAGHPSLNKLEVPRVEDVAAPQYDDHGLGMEPNNLAALGTVTLHRAFRWGKNVDLILTDNRSFRSQTIGDQPGSEDLTSDDFPDVVPEEAVEILDAGRDYNGGHPPDTLHLWGREIANWRKDKPPSSILGKPQKEWFCDTLKNSTAVWKLWGNTIGMLDARFDMQNLPASTPVKWPNAPYGSLVPDDWAGYRTERNALLEFVKANGITGFASLAGDRHAFFAGVLSQSLPPRAFEPVGVEFVTGSISAPGFAEALEYRFPKTHPLRALFLHTAEDGTVQRAVNFTTKHGVKASLALGETGNAETALAQSNPENAPHLSFIDWGGHGYVAIEANGKELLGEIVCIPRPLERSATPDGGPLAYRIRYRVPHWNTGERPALEQVSVEGTLPLSV